MVVRVAIVIVERVVVAVEVGKKCGDSNSGDGGTGGGGGS